MNNLLELVMPGLYAGLSLMFLVLGVKCKKDAGVNVLTKSVFLSSSLVLFAFFLDKMN